ncbi:V-type proton ATPase subunit S1 isoform X2 [Culicoides brevitarsis]|uniref:V-type proton ATPase subunit S1 isoform X2 n=1 Tax=Culicoides brevitarsis TaxID=469753 RepID=UPI00307B99CC
MAKLAFSLILCLFSCLTFVASDNVPVLLFGKSPFKVPALKTLQTDEFTNLVSSQLNEETVTVVFVEPKLSVEDLSQCKADDGVTCFKNLAALEERSYLPNVKMPVDGLFDNLDANKATIDQSDDVLEALENGNRVVFVYLDVAEESKDFESHDKIIAETFAKISQKYKNIVAIYTGQQSNLDGHVRNKRQVVADEQTPHKRASGHINKDPKPCDHFLIAAEQIVTRVDKDSAEVVAELTSCTSTKDSKLNKLEVTLQPSDLTMKFKQIAGTWSLYEAVKDSKPMKFPAYIYANSGFAYRCGGNFTFTNAAGGFVKIQNTQFMPDFEKDKFEVFNKDKVVYCEGFWSPAILAGLFVVFLLIFILLVGLSWIMDINTMDKFDDPKGKTITINANE